MWAPRWRPCAKKSQRFGDRETGTSSSTGGSDVGLPTVWAARYLAMNGKRRTGDIQEAPGDLALSGDGGFTMLMGDFLSLAQLGLPVKVVEFNNGTLGLVELEQRATGFLDFGTSFKNPNFAIMAEAAGTTGRCLSMP